ncbi:MAG: enoyl-CoA hydratase/isomerase family protein [Alphaproteobacteria bacterium]|nr:enoyl-CoA hydratase/isomerase family protein [Alphaproteobacteria bacterium]
MASSRPTRTTAWPAARHSGARLRPRRPGPTTVSCTGPPRRAGPVPRPPGRSTRSPVARGTPVGGGVPVSLVTTEIADGVAVLTMNRPERRNALSPALVEALHEALAAAGADPAVRAVVLTGAGPVFCAGGDLAGGMAGDGVVEGERARGRYGALLAALPGCRVPVIAAVQGDAMGGGLGIVAACDLAVVDEGARLGTPEIKVGLFPFVITAALQRNVGRKALLELMLTGGRVDAARAVALGLANRVAPAGTALAEARALAGEIAARSSAIVALGKRAFYDVADLDYASALALLNGRLTVNLLTEDAAEGIAAFVEKRAPAWKDR